MRRTAVLAFGALLASASLAAGQGLPEGTFASSQEGCAKLKQKTVAELGQDLGRKRQERNDHEEREIHKNDAVRHVFDFAEEGVMIDPHDADGGETRDVDKILRPQGEQSMRDAVIGRRSKFRRLKPQDQQRDGDREHAVAERFDTGRTFGHAHKDAFPG